MTYEEILRELGLLDLKKRRPRTNLIAVFNHLTGGHTEHRVYPSQMCIVIRHNGHKLEQRKFSKKHAKTFHCERGHFSRFLREAVDSPSLHIFKTSLDMAVSSLVQLACFERMVGLDCIPEVLSNLKYSVISLSFQLFKNYSRLFLLSFKGFKMIFENHFQTHAFFSFVLLGHTKPFSMCVYLF